VQVDIVADTICPWCFIGKRRFERALKLRPAEGVIVSWLAYQLNPDIPRDGVSRSDYMAAKFGDEERIRRLNQRLVSAGHEEEIEFNFEAIKRTPNTIDSHRLVRFAGRFGLQSLVMEYLYHAYFYEGRDIGDPETLVRIGADAGMDGGALQDFLASGAEESEILDEDDLIRRARVSGVPCFIIEEKYAVSGAQAPEIFLQIFDLVQQDRLEQIS